MVRGVTVPWHLLLTAGVGLWLMAAHDLLGTRGGAADSDHMVGALVVTVAVIAMAEVGRMARVLNAPLGARVIAAPWLLGGATTVATLEQPVGGGGGDRAGPPARRGAGALRGLGPIYPLRAQAPGPTPQPRR